MLGRARMIASGSWVSVTPGIWIGSSGKVIPRSQSQLPSLHPSVRHRAVSSRVASVGSLVCTQSAVKQAEMSSRRRVERAGSGDSRGSVEVVLLAMDLSWGDGSELDGGPEFRAAAQPRGFHGFWLDPTGPMCPA